MKYLSIKGGSTAVDFETAILNGFASDGGLYVPEYLPTISKDQLEEWHDLDFVSLAYEILSLFIDKDVMTAAELKSLLNTAYASFEHEDIIPIHSLQSRKDTFVMELFHGPTLSFKDVGLAFLVNLVHFFLERKNKSLSLVVATTGDTGPAAAYYAAGKSTLDAWVLYPKEMITEAQERQMTTLPHSNIYPVGVFNCPDGGDDLDIAIAKLFANKPFKNKLKLSSVNSINWGRVMMQMVHYFYGYFRVVDFVGEEINFSVPSGGFGNLCAGSFARRMGLPIHNLIAANNTNACLHRIFSQGVFSKENIHETPSSAIDILIPYNFWRHLYFSVGEKVEKIKSWTHALKEAGIIHFEKNVFDQYSKGFLSNSASDEETLDLIKEIYETENYLLDPHGAVALIAADSVEENLGGQKTICLATAHPAKFPEVIKKALSSDLLPEEATHTAIKKAKQKCEKTYTCDHSILENALFTIMEDNWDLKNTSKK